jgi:hypothetical protein
VSNIYFDEGYGYRVNGEGRSTNDFYIFQRRAYGRDGQQLPGSYNPETGQITIYRSAFSSRISTYRIARGEWIDLGANAGFQGGVNSHNNRDTHVVVHLVRCLPS